MGNLLENIRTIRRLKGISQESMAYELGIDYSTYGKIERNQIALTVERLKKIADIYGMNIEDIIYWGEDQFTKTFNEEDKNVSQRNLKRYVVQLNEKLAGYEKELESTREELEILREQIRDKERIIQLMEKKLT